MRLLLLSAFLLALPLWLFSSTASAQEGVHRCIGPDGNPLFTDQPCAAFQATPVQAAAKPNSAATATPAAVVPPTLCAANVAELRQSVADAFAARDPNRLAGLMLWNGYGRTSAVSDIRALGALMQHPLLDFGTGGDDATRGTLSAEPNPASASSAEAAGQTPPRPTPTAERELVLHTASNDASGAPRETRFAIVRRSGCLWLRNAE